MKRILALVFILLFTGELRAEIDYSQVPSQWVDYIKNEFLNIAGRRSKIMPLNDQNIIEIYHIEIPEAEADSLASTFLDKNSAKYAYVERDGKKFVRFFFDNSNVSKKQLEKIKKRYPVQIKQEFLGIKIQGWNSYFVWKAGDASYDPVILKLQRDIFNVFSKNESHNSQGILRNAIRVNEFIEKTMAESDNVDIRFLPERFTSTLHFGNDGSYSQLIRTLTTVEPISRRMKMIPLHGLLSKGEFLKQLAARKSMTVDQWIEKIYIPKLAEFSAEINLEHGFYVGGHTQNLLAFVDKKTGDLVSLGFRDFSDIMVDPYLRLSQGKTLNYQPLFNIWSEVNRFFVDSKKAKLPGFNIGSYTGQSIISIEGNKEKKAQYTVSFIEHYLKIAEEKLGRKIILSKKAQAYLARLKIYGEVSTHGLISAKKSVTYSTEVFDALKEIQQSIYEDFMRDKLPIITDKSFLYDQEILRRVYGQQENIGFVVYLDKDGVKKSKPGIFNKVLYGFDGKGIFTYHPRTKKIMSYAYRISSGGIKVIQSFPLPKGCLRRFLRVLAQ